MKTLARAARQSLGGFIFASGSLAALALLMQADQLGHWLSH